MTTITIQDWQRDLLKRVKSLLPELNRAELNRLGVSSGYYFIAASAILPVLIAGAGWPAALATMVGSVGANLISNVVQGAKDEADIARKLQTLPANDPAFEYIRILLEKLDADNVVQQGLPESDWLRLEMLLDRKFSQYNGGITTSQPTLVAPILIENVDKQRAREIAFRALKRAWWSERQVGKSRLQFFIWPMAFYDAQYLVKYQDRHTEDVRDSEGKVIDTRTIVKDGTSASTIQIVVFPSTVINSVDRTLPERVYEALNGLKLGWEINWGRNTLARISYDNLCVPFFESPFYQLFSGRRTEIVKKVRYWEKYKYSTKPGSINVSQEKITEDGHHLATRSFVKRWSSSTTSIKDVSSAQKDVRVAQYPFWVFEADSERGSSQVVIEGLGGNIVFMHVPASIVSHILVSIIGGIVLAMLATLLIYFLWSIYTLISIFF